MSRVRASDSFRAGLREAEIADLTRADQFCHRANRLLDRNVLVDAMLIIEIDMIDAETFQRRIASGANVFRTAVDRALAALKDLIAEFGRDDHPVAMLRERFADQLFVVPGAIDVRGVEEVDAELDCALEGRGGFAIVAWPVELRHPHASEAQF